jgi:hypothetical protein
MKIKSFFLLAFLFATLQFCYAQEADASKELKPIHFKATPIYSVLYIFKNTEKTVALDPRKNEKLDLESLDSRWVKTIQTIKAPEAKKIYGEKGAQGVVIIELKDEYTLSKEALAKLNWIKI